MSKKNVNTENNEVVTGTESTELATTTNPTDNAVKFTIESVSVPKRSGRTASLTFPIAELTPGTDQSFKVPATDDKVKAVTASIRAFAYRNEYNVILRSEDGGVRVWRSTGKVKS